MPSSFSRRVFPPTLTCHILFFLCLLLSMGSMAGAQSNTADTTSSQAQLKSLSESLSQTVAAEKEQIGQLKEQWEQLKQSGKTTATEINTYKLQVSAYSNLLHQATPIEELKKARADLESTLQNVSGQTKSVAGRLDEIRKSVEETQGQCDFNKEQLARIKKSAAEHPEGKAIPEQLKTLDQVLSEQLQVCAQIQDYYVRQISQLEEVQKSVADLAANFDRQIEEKQQQVLFDRQETPLISLEWQRIPGELQKLFKQAHQLYSTEFWTKNLGFVWKAGDFLLVKIVLLFAMTLFLLLRLRRFCAGLVEQLRPGRRWLALSLDLFQRSLLLLGTALLVYGEANLQDLSSAIPAMTVLVNMLLTWLLTGWLLDLLVLLQRAGEDWIPGELGSRLRSLLRAVRLFAVPYLALEWILGGSSSFLLLARVLFEIGLIVWSLHFWKAFRQVSAGFVVSAPRWVSSLRLCAIGWGYAVAFGGLILELAGYGQLALYWYASWGRSLGVLLWGTLVFCVLREWDRAVSAVPAAERRGSHHLRWLLIRLLWVGWAGALTTFVLVAWGAKRAVVIGFFRILNQSIQLGDMRFNLLGIAYAFLILAFTLAASRFWRQVLKKRILAGSGLEMGLQETITTLSAYVVWVFGILAALHALGVGTTSLAVVFGALGIGLGFGLQNIFNNFVSGLILLFERPIQVGEVIEIGGVWGTVRKINFRSTVVQTYDNATLIIPNSDFISNQVINWSFKDPRLRRSVTVGVAYGSDVELVRETLVEVAERHPKVLKYPKYDVLFSDFADSALIFILRFWSTLNDHLAVETEIRFEIDRLFRERKIEMSFPQRDIHIRSIAPDAPFRVEKDKVSSEVG